jgi:AAA15 family ATPase/GTPase
MITNLKLDNFTCFNGLNLDFCQGINVFIGKNGTGKTHILKLLYAILKANEIQILTQTTQKDQEINITNKLNAFFKPEQLGRLVQRTQGRQNTQINCSTKNNHIAFNFATNSKYVSISSQDKPLIFPSLYIPPREVLSFFEGFSALYEKREISFDETYYILAKSLELPLLKGRRYGELQDLIKPLEDAIDGKVLKENGRFYLKMKNDKMEINLVAEGFRKIATLMYLIANGELSKNSILFWDEPEANLNPKLITMISKILRLLASKGVQVFVATHDYLLTHQLSLYKEYLPKGEKIPEMKFFCLHKDIEMKVEVGETLADIANNPILNEYADFYDLEKTQMLYSKNAIKQN